MRPPWSLKARPDLAPTLRRLGLGCGVLSLMFATAGNAGAASSGGPGYKAHGSAKQVYVTGLHPRARMTLVNRHGRAVATKRADRLGGLLFRSVKPGGGYHVRHPGGGARSGPLRVFTERSAPPSTKTYDQQIAPSGYQYLTTRDGIELAINVHPPEDVTSVVPGFHPPPAPNGETPTLIEYSGYGYADPAGPQNGISILANLMGFTVVDVNMRGTGCSGGAFDFFEPLQSLDGYDVVQTIAHQPWVLHHKVGMMGISYGGISQLFTAATNPPSLAAISPLSVLDQTQTTLYPGGVLNTGFAVDWAKERAYEAKPASPHGGQAWAYQRIQEGDQKCKANQALHGEAANLLGKIHKNSHYRRKVADPLAPITFVKKIDVPVYLACQYTDEQTGGHCPTLPEHFTGTQRKWFTFTNGTHVDSLDPETFNRWYDFLQLFVAKRAPITYAPVIQAAAPVIYQEAMGISGQTLPADPVQAQPTYATALQAFKQMKPIRILFDSGAGGPNPGMPDPGFEHAFSRLPIPGTESRSWYLSTKGELHSKRSAKAHANKFTWDAEALPLTDFTGSTSTGDNGLWTATPNYDWKQHPKGSAVSYLSSPLNADTTVIGAGAVHLWVRSSKPNVDLQATVSEVRPDGKETFVQGGWVRGNERKLDRRKSTPLEPVLSLRESDVKPLPPNRFVKVTIPLYYEGHVYRAGSRIRITVAAPNGEQPIWSFGKTRPKGHANVEIAYSKHMPSRLTLPVVPGLSAPTGLPPCPGLRGEPCRNYKPFSNRTASP
jgi:predicted acyl esterase